MDDKSKENERINRKREIKIQYFTKRYLLDIVLKFH